MMTKTSEWASDIYWYSMIRNILSESKRYLFTIEIWQKLKDEYGYSYNIDRVEKELFNLQRTGYALSLTKRGKLAWMYPIDEKLLTLKRNKTVDSIIEEFITNINQLPTEAEIIAKLKEPIDPRIISQRLSLLSQLTNSIDKIIKNICQEKSGQMVDKKEQFIEITLICDVEKQNILFYETIINNLNGTIHDIDILTIIKIIDARKKLLK